MSMKKLYDKELERLMTKLSKIEPGSSKYNMLIGDIQRLSSVRNETVETDSGAEKWLKFSTDLAGTIIPTGAFIMLELVGLDYEEKGYISSTFLKGLIGKIRPSMK